MCSSITTAIISDGVPLGEEGKLEFDITEVPKGRRPRRVSLNQPENACSSSNSRAFRARPLFFERAKGCHGPCRGAEFTLKLQCGATVSGGVREAVGRVTRGGRAFRPSRGDIVRAASQTARRVRGAAANRGGRRRVVTLIVAGPAPPRAGRPRANCQTSSRRAISRTISSRALLEAGRRI